MRDRRRTRASTPSPGNSSSRNGIHQAYNPDAAPNTALKQDQLFKACFEHATIGFSITDLEGLLLEVNEAYCAITGYTDAELRQTHDFKTLTHPDDLPANVEKIRALLDGEIPEFKIEKRYIRKDGQIVWVRNS